MQKYLASHHNLPVYSVSELNRQVKNLLEVSFMTISVTGEVSNLSIPASGHWYFSLKDKKAQVRCAMFRSANILLRNPPENGTMVVVTARVSLYEGRGDFQLLVDKLEAAGTGALLLAFEELKSKLAKEGLFSAERKKTLPSLPKRIGIITSPTGAAIRDILTVLKRRFPAIPVLVVPVPVQGSEAAPAITQALQLVNQLPTTNPAYKCDVIIISRGGGSLEDLWAFNDETLARAIAASQIPVVSGVGHETDFTICDLIADVRTPTPSAAAECISPDAAEILLRISELQLRLIDSMRRQIKYQQTKTAELASRLTHPVKRLEVLFQRLDDSELRLQRLTTALLTRHHSQLKQLSERLQRQLPVSLLNSCSDKLSQYQLQLSVSMQTCLTDKKQELLRLTDVMHSVSPLATLARGYSITTDSQGEIIRTRQQVSKGDIIRTKLAAGELVSAVIE
jgi:exodeoxyribonuclease VII large subunit